MTTPKDEQSKAISPLLTGILYPTVLVIIIYFLKFFGFSIQKVLRDSIAVPANAELYTNILLVLLLCLLGLIAYLIRLRKIPEYNRRNQEECADIQRKRLGAFLLDEIERTKRERQELIKRPKPESPEIFFQMKEHGRFLDGQDEVLHNLSKWIVPPNK